jgi:hypothetical protein
MTNPQLEQAKNQLGQQTQNLEHKVSKLWNEYSPNYTNLEPWKRGLILIAILASLVLVVYYLTHESQDRKAQRKLKAEQAQEERLLKRMELLKKLRE